MLLLDPVQSSGKNAVVYILVKCHKTGVSIILSERHCCSNKRTNMRSLIVFLVLLVLWDTAANPTTAKLKPKPPPQFPKMKPKKKPAEEFVPPSKPNYTELEQWHTSTIDKQPEFIAACKEMAGYYKDPTRNPKLSKTLMMGGINYSYRDFYHNFKCYTDRLGIKYLPISLDQNIYEYITSNKLAPTFTMPDLPGREKVKSEASGFGG